MTKIKYIHCLGTSHTAGGGFEFGSNNPERNVSLETYYSIEGEEKSQFNFSFPGQLQKLIGNGIQVFNHAKQGYGNDRVFRIVYDIINKIGFNSDENLFIFEFAGMGRREYYSNKLKEFITLNWQHEIDENNIATKNGAKLLGVASSYFYETQKTYDFIKENNSFFESYVENFVNFDLEFNNISRETEFFLSYVEKLKLNYYFSSPPIVGINGYDKSKEIIFGDGKFFKKSSSILDFSGDNELIISKETRDEYNDSHNSLKSNKIVAHVIYNKLIDDEYILGVTKEIDWEWYYTNNLINKK
jgi:hypothetical protein